MATIEKLGEPGRILVALYAIGQRGPDQYAVLTGPHATNNTELRSRRVLSSNVLPFAEVVRVEGPSHLSWNTPVTILDAVGPCEVKRGEEKIINTVDIFLDPKDPDTVEKFAAQGIRLRRSKRNPSGLSLERFEQPGMEDYLSGRAKVERHPTAETRPWPISTFVVEKLPKLLKRVRDGRPGAKIHLQFAAGRAIKGIERESVTALLDDPIATRIAGLDLAMLLFGYHHSGIEPPAALTEHLERLSEASGQPPTLTFERLVLDNPLKEGDPRLFTTGEVSKSEFGFLLGLLGTEELWGLGFEDLRYAQRDLFRNRYKAVEDANFYVARGTERIRASADVMHRCLTNLNPAHFGDMEKGFRFYHLPLEGMNDEQGYSIHPGPTGLDSSLGALRYIIGGEFLPDTDPKIYDSLARNIQFFPVFTQEALREAIDSHKRSFSVNDLDHEPLTPPSLVWQAWNLGDRTLLDNLRETSSAVKKVLSVHFREGGKVAEGTGDDKLAEVFHPGRTSRGDRATGEKAIVSEFNPEYATPPQSGGATRLSDPRDTLLKGLRHHFGTNPSSSRHDE